METIDFSPGDVIIKNGEKGDYVYIIKSGNVKSKVGSYECTLSEREPDVFGLEALINEIYTETCTAVNQVKVIRCAVNEFLEIYAKTDLGKKALESFIKRTAKALGWI